MPRRTVAVVTGDVNASRRLLEKDARRLEYMLRSCFQDVVATLNDVWAAGDLPIFVVTHGSLLWKIR